MAGLREHWCSHGEQTHKHTHTHTHTHNTYIREHIYNTLREHIYNEENTHIWIKYIQADRKMD